MKMKGLRLAFPIALLFVLFFSSLSFAEGYYRGRPTFNAQGFYLGVNLPYNSIGGDFNSTGTLFSPDTGETFYFAEPDDAFGFGIAGGFRGPSYAIEFAYMRSEHDDFSQVDPLGGPGTSILDVVSLDFKWFFLADRNIQPYLLLGGSWINFEQENRAGIVFATDASYDNLAIDFGGGISFFVNRNLSLNTGITYRWTQFDQAHGDFDYDLNHNIDFSVLTYNVGISYIFDLRRR